MRTEEDQSRPEAIVNPIPLSLLGSPEGLLVALHELREESLPQLKELTKRMEAGTGLRSEINAKTRNSTEEKANRPSTLKSKPWFTIAHIRDFLRFRTGFTSLDEALTILAFFTLEADHGRLGIVKFETAKFARPNPYGWRMIATDIRLASTGMIVEHYMSYADMILANGAMTHAVYERWRPRGEDLTIADRKRMVAEIGLCRTANLTIFAEAAGRGDDPGLADLLEMLRAEVACSAESFCRTMDRLKTQL
ncbi:hypothetical protein [Salinarimonas sp.]|uniref:hypothetical protein n=1 Tax=Salinarimonas sp. TaxID=2766526 RepID=UPI0032D9A9DA